MKTSNRRLKTSSERGSALLTVLWLSAALAAIALSISSSVRGDGARASGFQRAARLVPSHRRG